MVNFFVTDLRPCGPTNQLKYTVNQLAKLKIDAKIFTLKKNTYQNVCAGINDSVKVEWFLSLAFFKSVVSKQIFHSQGPYCDFLCYLLRLFAGVQWYSSLRNIPYEDYPDLFPRFSWLVIKLHLFFLKRSKVIACSKVIRDKMRHELPAINYVNNSILSTQAKKYSLEARRPTPCEKLKCVYVGSLIARKNIEGLRIFAESYPDLELHVFGEGEQSSLISSLQNVIMHGFQSEVWEVARHMDFFISLSLSEGMPNSVLEAIDCVMPMVLSDIPQHRDIFDGNVPPCVILLEVPNSTVFV